MTLEPIESPDAGRGIQVPDATGAGLAFVSLLGFVAGFNERFAQDMLTGTTVPMSSGISPPPM